MAVAGESQGLEACVDCGLDHLVNCVSAVAVKAVRVEVGLGCHAFILHAVWGIVLLSAE